MKTNCLTNVNLLYVKFYSRHFFLKERKLHIDKGKKNDKGIHEFNYKLLNNTLFSRGS